MGTKNISLPAEAEKLDWLRSAIAEGVRDIEEGRIIPSEQVLEEVERRGQAWLSARRKSAR